MEYEICVLAITGCDSTEQICIPITVHSPENGTRDTSFFCSEEFPFIWHGKVINGAGDYTVSIPQPGGCSIDSFWTVREYPSYSPGNLDTIVCEQLDLNGQIFSNQDIILFFRSLSMDATPYLN
jgi:hypothetical protein